jgi:hypothetical protein
MAVSPEAACALAAALPEVTVVPSSKGMPRYRVRDRQVAQLMPGETHFFVYAAAEERLALPAASPAAFAPVHNGVLVALARVDEAELGELLEEAWRLRVPKSWWPRVTGGSAGTAR